MGMKKIVIDGKEIAFRATGATPIYYREWFHREFMSDMQKLNETVKDRDKTGQMPIEVLSVFEDIAYCMAKQANKDIPDKAEWFDQFEMFSIYEVVPHIIELWGVNQQSMVDIKKK